MGAAGLTCYAAIDARASSRITQRDLVGLGDSVGLDRSKTLAEARASLPQELKRDRGWALLCCALGICPMLLDQVRLEGCGNFINRLEPVVDSPIPRRVLNHAASISVSRNPRERQGWVTSRRTRRAPRRLLSPPRPRRSPARGWPVPRPPPPQS